MKERLDKETLKKLIEIGNLADEMGYHAYLVGGFVRDLLLRIYNNDIDIVIEGDGLKFAVELAKRYDAKVSHIENLEQLRLYIKTGLKST